MTFNEIIGHINNKDLRPVYFLHGEEAFYIDKIVDLAAESILDEGERDFNQTVFYAKDTPPIDVLMRLRVCQ